MLILLIDDPSYKNAESFLWTGTAIGITFEMRFLVPLF